MKIDMHCHVHEGSIDSRVSLDEYITVLKEKGFDGMLITDHDSYHGYRHWKYEMKGKAQQDFVVLKGIEYDTLDAGHMLCIMPEGVRMRLLELKGLPVSMLIEFVHRHGGILGPAHPYGAKYMSMTNTKRYRKSQEFVKRFDFIEVFNACESQESNDSAARLAAEYGKPGVGGSDAHKTDCIGTGYTILPEMVTCETELINLIREKAAIQAGGVLYGRTTKEKMGAFHKILADLFWFYNRGGAMLKYFKRRRKDKIENPVTPVDPIEIPYLKKAKKFRSKK